jgi:hypothetical protein
MTILCLLFKVPSLNSIRGKCFTYPALGRNLVFARCESYLNSILCCTHTTGSSTPSYFLLYPCPLSPLTLAIFMSSTQMLTSSLSFKSLPFPSTQFESCELPISSLISFHFLSPYKFCVNSITGFFPITLTLSSINLALILIFIPTLKKSPLFHLNLRVAIYLYGPWTYPLLFHLQVLS